MAIPSSIHHTSVQSFFLLLTITTTTFVNVVVVVHAAREDLIAIIERLNSDLLELRNEIEYSISNRCASIAGCAKSSYDECQSEYTKSQQCPAFEKYGASMSVVIVVVVKHSYHDCRVVPIVLIFSPYSFFFLLFQPSLLSSLALSLLFLPRLRHSRMWNRPKLQRSIRSYHLHRSSTCQLGHRAECQPHRCRRRRGRVLHPDRTALDGPKV